MTTITIKCSVCSNSKFTTLSTEVVLLARKKQSRTQSSFQTLHEYKTRASSPQSSKISEWGCLANSSGKAGVKGSCLLITGWLLGEGWKTSMLPSAYKADGENLRPKSFSFNPASGREWDLSNTTFDSNVSGEDSEAFLNLKCPLFWKSSLFLDNASGNGLRDELAVLWQLDDSLLFWTSLIFDFLLNFWVVESPLPIFKK